MNRKQRAELAKGLSRTKDWKMRAQEVYAQQRKEKKKKEK